MEPAVALLRADESSVHLLTEEPPPYTEVAQNGHVSLMHGHSPQKHLQGSSRSAHQRSASFTAGELEASTASALLPLNTQGDDSHMQAGLPTSVRAGTEILAMEYEDLLQPPDYSECSDRLQLERRSLQEYGSNEYQQIPHHGGHLHNVGPSSAIFPPRSITRSRSLDAASLEGRTLNRMDNCPTGMFPRPLALLPTPTRAGTLPPPLAPFPPRPGTIPPLHPLLPHHPHQPLPPVASTAINLQNRPVRPPPLRSQTLPPSFVANSSSDRSSLSTSFPESHLSLRLPPIQLQGEDRTQGGKQHRKRHKRKRGQTWHAERVPLVEQNVVVAE